MIENTARFLRGGAWLYNCTDYFRAYYRPRRGPDNRDYYPGFRCVYPIRGT